MKKKIINQNNNIHKRQDFKSDGRTRTVTLIECQNLIIRILNYKSKQIVHKFVAKLSKYMILMLTFLE